MATTTVTNVQSYMLLNNGTDTQGNVKTVRQSIGSIDKDNWDADKALAIVDKLENCLSKGVYKTQVVQTSTISE